MEQDQLLFAKQFFGTAAATPRYFLAGYIIGDEPRTRTEINLTIEGRYPSIYKSFFSSYANNASGICRHSLSSLGLAEDARKVINHPKRGVQEVSAFVATDLVEQLGKLVHFWWRGQLESGFNAAQYLAHLAGPTLDAPYNRALVIDALSKGIGQFSLEALAEHTGLTYSKLYKHLEALEALGAVIIQTQQGLNRGKYKRSSIQVQTRLHVIEKRFLKPVLDELAGSNVMPAQAAPKSFNADELFELLSMHYSSRAQTK